MTTPANPTISDTEALDQVIQLAVHTSEQLERLQNGLVPLLEKWMMNALSAAQTDATQEATRCAADAARLAAQAVAQVQLARRTGADEASQDLDGRVLSAVRRVIAEEHAIGQEQPQVDPCGKWSAQTYHRLAIVHRNGSSYIAQSECGPEDVPGKSGRWMLLAAKGASGGSSVVAVGGGPGVGPAEIEAMGFVRGDIDGGNAIGGGDAFNP